MCEVSVKWIIKFETPQNKKSGKLSGLTSGVKDLFHIANYPTSAGNPDWLASHKVPDKTSSSVNKLIEAGAVIVGKTLTDELAYSLNGVNVHYGTPNNYACPDRIPGGSSSGSAAAVANGEVDIGLGTDTGGSIRVPASYNGLFGLRPTHGKIPMDNMVPLAPSFDTVGWLTQNLSVMKKVAQTLLPDEMLNRKKMPSKLVVLKPKIAGKEIWNDVANKWLLEHISQFESVVDIVLPEDFFSEASDAFRLLQGQEIWQQHGEWITNQHPHFSPDIADRFQWCSQLTEADFAKAKQLKKQINITLDEYLPSSDYVMLLPTTPGAAPLLGESPEFMNVYRTQLMGLTALAGLSGRPQLSLPVLKDQGAPWGLSLLGYQEMDISLIDLAENLL